MLYLIVSRSGGGKTTYVTECIEKLASKGKKSLLIVPEQYSFTSEKNLILRLGEKLAANADVHSFTALADRLTEGCEARKKPAMSASSSAVMMNMALSDVKDELTLYAKHSGYRTAANEFVSLAAEFKQNAISADMIDEACGRMPASLLKAKLTDISKIIRAYEKRAESAFFNPDDLLTILNKSQKLADYACGKTVFIDSFRGFTSQEYSVIGQLMKYADDVYVTLCADYEGKVFTDNYNITEQFAKTKRTASRLVEEAEKAGVKHPVPGSAENMIFTCGFERYESPEIAYLENSLASQDETPYDGKCRNIILCKTPDIYSECEFTAATAKKLIREKGFRCRDIAIIARKAEAYESPLKSALKKCGIPVYEDFRKPVDVSPVINTVSAALSAAAGSFDNDSMMRYIKSGLSGLDAQEAAMIENYCFVWNIRGRKWDEEWRNNPEGLGDKEKDTDEYLDRLNRLRLKITKPLKDLKYSVKDSSEGTQAVSALWSFIENISLRDNIINAAEKLCKDGEEGAAFELERMWDLLISLLNELAILLKGETVGIKRLSDLFEIMLSVQTLGSLPQGLDEIVIGSADRMRINAPKAVIIIGANEGVFPPEATPVSALTVKDRYKMAQFGLELSDSPEWKIADENLIVYSSLCCPTSFLTVTCSLSSADGSEQQPGSFYKYLKKIFPDIIETDSNSLSGLFLSEGKQTAFEQLAKSADGEFRQTMREYFSGDPEYAGRLKAIDNVAGIRNFTLTDKDTLTKLYGEKLRLSASKVEKFYQCPFSYFCNYGLKLKKLNEAKLDSLQIGNITHSVLENLLKDPGTDELIKLTDAEKAELIAKEADEYIEKFTKDGFDTKRFGYQFSVLKRVIFDILTRICEEFEQSEFRPEEFELAIGEGDIPDYSPGADDSNISLFGKADRIDTAVSRETGKKYFRVIDYKTGNKDFHLGDILNGINLQMLIYMFAISSSNSEKFAGFKPAGVFYYKANTKIINEDENPYNSSRMSGVVLEDAEVIRMMESEAQGKFINTEIKNGKIDGVALTEDEFNIIKEKTDHFINEMARLLREGDIMAVPKVCTRSDSKSSPCDYCDFKSVCRYDEDIPTDEYNYNSDKKEREKLYEEAKLTDEK